MVHYKLQYFPVRGAAEIVRQIFAVAKQDYEDIRVPHDEWAKLKEHTPFGQMPVLEEDGKQLAQSFAIARYLARKFNLAGSNPWEQAQVDALADQWKDFNSEIRPFFVVFAGFGQGDLAKLKEEVLIPATKKHFPFFVNAIKRAGSGYLVGHGLTWIDLLVSEAISFMSTVEPGAVEAFPELKTHAAKVRSNPELKKWIETRPETPF